MMKKTLAKSVTSIENNVVLYENSGGGWGSCEPWYWEPGCILILC